MLVMLKRFCLAASVFLSLGGVNSQASAASFIGLGEDGEASPVGGAFHGVSIETSGAGS